MESQSTVERLRRTLESEEGSEGLSALPSDTYFRLADYSQKLRAASAPSGDDLSGRLAKKQLWLIEVMARQLLQLRLSKASSQPPSEDESLAARLSKKLLDEERFVDDPSSRRVKEDRFVKAVSEGQPSFFSLIQHRESQRMTTIRIATRVGEIMGTDLKRYGPFEVNDVARLPQANAEVMVASKQAAFVLADD